MDNNNSLSNSAAQQFCLRWHNHQTSLLSSLPLLLDQSHLTDVTLSAEGRTIRAHRIVLSACSTFFLELFQTLESPLHPVIVLPGASFSTMVALLTFMYSGEVNVYEEQISELLGLAATLGIKGLADFNGNISKTSPKCTSPQPKETETSHTPSTTPNKMTFPLETLFSKAFPFCPTLLGNPLGFTQTALTRGAELFARYQNQCRINAAAEHLNESLDENGNQKCFTSNNRKQKNSNMSKIDKIAESLRSASTSISTESVTDLSKTRSHFMEVDDPSSEDNKQQQDQQQQHQQQQQSQSQQQQQQQQQQSALKYSSIDGKTIQSSDSISEQTLPPATLPKSVNSKLYATCFICHKQLSNQYNLRVHLETHQNVRYACNVCSHVSRSKDALRKHVSYRHPGAPSPCESEARRKRSKTHAPIQSQKSDDTDQSPLTLQHSHPLLALQHHLSAQCFLNEEQSTNDSKETNNTTNSLDQLDESPMQ